MSKQQTVLLKASELLELCVTGAKLTNTLPSHESQDCWFDLQLPCTNAVLLQLLGRAQVTNSDPQHASAIFNHIGNWMVVNT